MIPAIIGAAALVSLLAGLYQLFVLPGLHAEVNYDDGVWFASAVRLANGVLPYRHFVLDQPPGVPLLMAPFGLWSDVVGTRAAFGDARLVTPLVESGTVIATGWLLRHRGALAVAIGCGAVALYPAALTDQSSVMLEPFCALFSVLALAAAFCGDRLSNHPRRLFVAGVAFGLAGSCKAFAVLPFSVVLVALVVGDHRRRALCLLSGAVAAFGAICGPFVALAPTDFFRQVVVAQLTRSSVSVPRLWDRLFALIGFLPATRRDPVPDDPPGLELLVVAALGALILCGWAVVVKRSRRYAHSVRTVDDPLPGAPEPATGGRRAGSLPVLDRVALAILVVTAGALAAPPAFYYHYAAYLAPFLAIVLATAAANVARRVPRTVAVATAVGLLAATFQATATLNALQVRSEPAGLLDATVPAGACVISDDVPALLLADRFTSTTAGCPQMVDAYGTTISADHGFAPSSRQAAAGPAVAVWRALFAHSQYILLVLHYQNRRIPWTPALRRYLRVHFRARHQPIGIILTRRTEPAPLPRRPAGSRRGAGGP